MREMNELNVLKLKKTIEKNIYEKIIKSKWKENKK